MKLRSLTAALAVTAGLIAPVVGAAGPAAAQLPVFETCRNEFTGQLLLATRVGTESGDHFSASQPEGSPYKLRNGDVVVARGGRDIVDAAGLSNLTVCLGDGDDYLVNGSSAFSGISVRGGPGNDDLRTTLYSDAVNGLEGFDVMIDPSPFDWDVCRQVELTQSCEVRQ